MTRGRSDFAQLKTNDVELWLWVATLFFLQSPFDLQFRGTKIGFYLEIIFILLPLYYIASRLPRAISIVIANPFPVIFFFYSLASALYTNNGNGTWGSPKDFVLPLIAGLGLATRYPLETICRIVLLLISVSIFLSLAWVIFFPFYGVHQLVDVVESGHEGSWRGIYVHKNTMGEIVALSIVFIFVFREKFMRNKAIFTIFISIALLLLIKSDCATAYVIVFSLFLFNYIYVRTLGFYRLLAIASAVLVSFVVYHFFVGWILEEFLNRTADLTGRTYIWQTSLSLIGSHWLFGFGMGATMGGDFQDQLLRLLWRTGMNQAHSSYIEIVANVGVIGLLIWLPGLVRAFRRAGELAQNREVRWAASMCMMIILFWLIDGIVECTPARPGNFANVIIYIALFSPFVAASHRPYLALKAGGYGTALRRYPGQ